MNATITGTVIEVIRHGHTVYGNPTMSVRLDSPDHSAAIPVRIQNDAGLVYEIENPKFRERPHTFALTRAGRISRVVREREVEADGYNGITRTLVLKLEQDGSPYSVEDVRAQWREYCDKSGPVPWATWLPISGWLD